METKNNIYLSTDLKFNSVTDIDGFLKIEGYGAHYGVVNLNNEIVDKNSFNEFFGMYNDGKITPKLNWNHDGDQIIGTIDDIISDNTGLYFTCSINKDVKICQENLIPNIEKGVIDSFSTEGFIKNGYDGVIINSDGSYYVKDFILTALAVCAVGADYNAKFRLANFLKSEETRRNKWYMLM